MALRTYIPALLFVVNRICVYTARYDTKIRANLTEPQLAAYNTLRTACDAFMAVAPVLPIGD